MKYWLRRWLAYLVLPAGGVLLGVPLCTHRLADGEQDFFYLENSLDLLAGEVVAPSEPAISPQEDLEAAVRQMNERRQERARLEARAAEVVNPDGYPVIRSEDLAPFPAMADAVNSLQHIFSYLPVQAHKQERVPPAEWLAFREAVGLGAAGAFQYGRHVFKGSIETDAVKVPVEVPGLKLGRRVAGGLFLLLGFWALYGAYPPAAAGIRIGPRSAVIIWDACILLGGSVFTWWFLEFIFWKFFETASAWVEDFSIGMGLFWVVLANPVLALITTAMAAQILRITAAEIELQGLSGQTAVPWAAVEGFSVSQLHSVRKVAGTFAPHRVMKVLNIRAGAETLAVMEPPYQATKREIIAKLLEFAPESIKPSINAAAKEW